MSEPSYIMPWGGAMFVATFCFCGEMRQLGPDGWYLPHTNARTGGPCPPVTRDKFIENMNNQWKIKFQAAESLHLLCPVCGKDDWPEGGMHAALSIHMWGEHPDDPRTPPRYRSPRELKAAHEDSDKETGEGASHL